MQKEQKLGDRPEALATETQTQANFGSAPQSIFIGTSGWAYKAWQPEFYAPKLPQKQFLSYYATQLTAVEVNYTFRRLLSEKTIANWLAETPATFRFVVKAHQSITHFRHLKNAEEPLQRFLSSIQPVASAKRLGPVLFQLPESVKADTQLLDAFLANLPRALRAAFEFRHTSWFDESIFEVLKRHNAALCIAESDDLQTPEVLTANFAYFRYRRSDYAAPERKMIAAKLAALAGQLDEIYAFFKHEEHPESALMAVDVLRQLAPDVARKAG